MKQRMVIAMAMTIEPEFLLADEMPSHSDIQSGYSFSSRCTKYMDKYLKEKPKLKQIAANYLNACHLF
ncbi:oligopeptide transporter ATP-binding component [Clostridium puniceum]|uniref:Oligopeptide transporter ATP-binding component n=1 Tax=Clostridium puniceum TaxID=29367 RepID=A0A1S8TDL4_9CLOT|nr:hypothetical protein [Clostridium puniceum]OOM75890.1 oligopeptide transporter ATP-binding component [Clostridium puniceum]